MVDRRENVWADVTVRGVDRGETAFGEGIKASATTKFAPCNEVQWSSETAERLEMALEPGYPDQFGYS